MSNAEAAGVAAIAATYFLKPPVHALLARLDLAPDPDPVAHDVRTVAFLQAVGLDPVEALGVEAVAAAEAWTPDTAWVPFRDRMHRVVAARTAFS
ncbi:MAG: hypothetical protein ABJH68_04050 [Ilumatobacter sp.]|uniref:hypothetical protein n=1 Tax=Ilumatobacter sp. TaxID=1967498 RepID=UPI00329A642E